jgi:DNA helicase II / ATP-dependent DNA helicase PcrA
MDTRTHPPTDEQIDILNSGTLSSDNMMIEALAGTGKTHTLEALGNALPKKPALYLVFNKKNAAEAEGKMPYNVEVRTLNSIGHRTWAATQYKKLTLDDRKTYNIFREMTSESKSRSATDEMWACYETVRIGVGLAKSLGYVPSSYSQGKSLATRNELHRFMDEVPDDLAADIIDEILTRSIKAAFSGKVDFNDQVYMPAVFPATCTKFPVVLVDEYQDLSPTNHALLGKVAKHRLIGVGDPYQNIYGFRGASAGGMHDAKSLYTMSTFPLTTSFRCPSEIVKHVHWRVPSYRWHRIGGTVERPSRLSACDIPDDATIICRNNAPILAAAFKLISIGKSVNVAGTEIGPRLVGIMRKLGPETMQRTAVLHAIDEWLERKLEAESKSAEDMAQCMKVFAEHGRDLEQAIAYAEHLFKQEGSITLTTGHKAKGLEWPTVIHLDPWLVRRKRTEQDQNLDYVISTRSSDTLIEVDSEAIEW